MLLHGLLVDLVPFTREFHEEKMHTFWNNESRWWATMGDNQPVTRAEIKRMNEERIQGHERGYTGIHFMMRARDGNIIGSAGLNWLDYWNRYGMLGSWIGEPDYWSGGHGTDALLLLAEYAFNWYDLRRLILFTMGPNIRAQRNVERCGFKLEARQRDGGYAGGEWVTSLAYGMLREEWQGRETLVEQFNLRERAEKRYGALD
ncbi:MAG: GNAT family N-acetyltransferase [Anaerolineae bacterium]|nr:GNAT family N-acetyltransferase [Anaerolineae bacterium]